MCLCLIEIMIQYFGTQPHFDDPRVEWWFGDASKSLLMLPEEYFGSFDLVLVDLSETLMSNTVTQELDSKSVTSNNDVMKSLIMYNSPAIVLDSSFERTFSPTSSGRNICEERGKFSFLRRRSTLSFLLFEML